MSTYRKRQFIVLEKHFFDLEYRHVHPPHHAMTFILNASSPSAWIATPVSLVQLRSPSIPLCSTLRPRSQYARGPWLRRGVVTATAQSGQPPATPSPLPPLPPVVDTRGINGTTPFYLALVAAQALPFIKATSGLAGDFIYFTVTALSCIVIGVRRAPLEPPSLSAALSSKQAIAAPFTASLFLFGSYLLLKYTTIDINIFFNLITLVGGTLCLKESLDPVFHSLLAPLKLQDVVVVPGEDAEGKEEGEARPAFTLPGVMSSLVAVGTVAAYMLKVEPSFVFSNVIAVALGARVLSLVKPSSFLVGAGLLTGLFFYDIFWVFGSEVMVSVATQIDTPGKLLFPRDPALSANVVKYPYAILGLGDVCIPGLFITLAQSLDMRFATDVPKLRQPYFAAAISAYTAALFSCFYVNYTTNAAQPALLYLVPALIGSSLAVGAARGELKEVWSFSNEDAAPPSEEENM